jgi:hypothetical protein
MTALSLLIKASVTLALALGGVRLARRNRASLRHLLLTAGFGGLLVLPLASMVVPPLSVAVPVSLPAAIDVVDPEPNEIAAAGPAQAAAGPRAPRRTSISASVLDPLTRRAAFWRTPIVVRRPSIRRGG